MQNTKKAGNKIPYSISNKILLERLSSVKSLAGSIKKSEAKRWLSENKKMREAWA
ncbi:MAG: hypothetical protein UU24_C0041G0003 [Candidatus Nomurabacteria bacterium GW2011_GWA2_40_9]|uniref:Uncharacterized protein n=1 Tax=Candidatus Nomurabacteria bacterium GW2011_GWA2_40_9 TaxID=1618734 RepID=A0A0G0WS22_9BACT|nr:MAG: hypothetical protein UU24_C0041G0003 [Candidatus Nomurabacteria bacterium GW2011_GWA2_40_9]